MLVTGASSGIGAATARALVERGFRVWAGVRDDAAADRARALGDRCTPVVLDVTDAAQIAAVAERIGADGGLYGLVNNAGVATGAPLEALPIDALRAVFEVNVFGALAVTQAVLPLLRRTLGRIVMMSSVQGRIAAPFVGPYAASKHALEALSDSLRAELLASGVDVAIVEPGAVKTPIWERGAREGALLADTMDPLLRARYADDIATMQRVSRAFEARAIPPERVAAAVVHALSARRPRARYVVGFDARARLAIGTFVPDRLRDRLLRRPLRAHRKAARVIVRLLPILGITFIDIFGFSMLLPLMPFFVKHFGATDVVVGFVAATYSVSQLIAGPVWGNVSDRIGRKAVLIVSQAGATIGWVMLGFAPTIAWVFLSRAIEGLSGGNIGVTQAYVADLVAPAQRGRAFAYLGAAFSAGFVFGPALAAWLSSAYGFATPFFVAAGLQALTLVLTVLLLPDGRGGATDEAKNAPTLRDIFASLADPTIAPILWLRLVFVFGLYGWFGAMALILNRQLGWGIAETGIVFAIFGVYQVALQIFVVGRTTERLGNRAATNAGMACCLAAFVLVPFATSVPLAVVVLALFGVGLSHVNAAFPALASDAAPDDRRGTVLGVVSGLDSLAGFVMPPVVTGVLGVAGVTPAVAIVIGLVLGGLVIGLVEARKAPAAPPLEAGTGAD